MALYKSTTSFAVIASNSDEDAQIIQQLNELAALQDQPVGAIGKRVLREVLPSIIAEVREQVKNNSQAVA